MEVEVEKQQREEAFRLKLVAEKLNLLQVIQVTPVSFIIRNSTLFYI